MSASYRTIQEHEADIAFGETEAFALDVLVGLTQPRKEIPSKYLYDAKGSDLFKQIMDLPEYYISRCETDILQRHKGMIADTIGGEPFNLVELGAGDGRKTTLLLKHFLERNLQFQYVPIDISESAMAELTTTMNEQFPSVDTQGLASEYLSGLKWLNNRNPRRNVVLFLGSSVGNFTQSENMIFFRNLWNVLNHGDLALIGFDQKKEIDLLLSAYNDSSGITRAFNLNLLTRINRELGGEFDVDRFRHFGTYDVFSGTMLSYLVSLETQQVFIEKIGRSFSFEPWEPIHTEFSHKYLESDIDLLAYSTGFVVEQHLYDSRRWFIDSIWRVHKPGSVS